MSLPDDVPRSPTGRIPRWVRDEVQGRAGPPPGWTPGGAPTEWAPGEPPPTGPPDRTWIGQGAVPGPERDRRRAPAGARPARPHAPEPRWHLFGQPWYAYVLVGVVLVLSVGEGLDRYWDHSRDLGPDFSVVVRTLSASELPPPFVTTSTRPTPGFEEIGAPLSMAPVLATTSTAYAFLDTQLGPTGGTVPFAWSPCRPIHFVVDPTGAPDGFVDQVVASFGAVSMATGLIVVYDGLTQEPTTPERAAFQPTVYGDRWAPVLVQLADQTTYSELEGNVAGLASTQPLEDRAGVTYYITGAIHLDATLLDQPAHRGIPPYVPVLRHEIGHLFGLDHIDDPSQLMNPSAIGVATFQTGDLTGLAELGQGACAPLL